MEVTLNKKKKTFCQKPIKIICLYYIKMKIYIYIADCFEVGLFTVSVFFFSQVNGDFVLVENVKIPYPGELELEDNTIYPFADLYPGVFLKTKHRVDKFMQKDE